MSGTSALDRLGHLGRDENGLYFDCVNLARMIRKDVELSAEQWGGVRPLINYIDCHNTHLPYHFQLAIIATLINSFR